MRASDSLLGLNSARVKKIYFEYPVLGIITDIDDANPITEARTDAFVIGGKGRNTLTNHLQLEISDISPSFKLQYTVFYKPARTGRFKIGLLGFDRYAIRISWNYKGEEISKKEWRSIDTDEVTSAPIGRIWGGLVSDKDIKVPPKTVPKRPLK